MADQVLSPEVENDARRLLRQLGQLVEDEIGPFPFTVEVAADSYRCVLARLASDHGQPMLSPREREIATMVSSGCTNKGIADALDISTWTVASHLRRIFAKLGVTSRAAMVAQVVVSGVSATRLPAGAPPASRREGAPDKSVVTAAAEHHPASVRS